MSTYSSLKLESVLAFPIKSLEYRDMESRSIAHDGIEPGSEERAKAETAARRAEVELSEAEFLERLKRERADATQQAEQRLRQEYELKLQAARAPIAATIANFDVEREEYYARVEAELVQLALAIAAKILHREAQVDPMLVAAILRMAIEKLREGSKVMVRVGSNQGRQWKEYFAAQASCAHVEVVEDAGLSEHDCLLETELGVANFGLDAQLKEVEQGFFDLLALRPASR